MSTSSANLDSRELQKFDDLASRWWDPKGEFRPLHAMNPARLGFIDQYAQLNGKRVLDVGCGGGILSEGMAGLGASVTGIDMAEGALRAARAHAEKSGLAIDYQQVTAEAFAEAHPQSFDVVTCMELLEHVPDPGSLILACRELVKPGGWVFFSTLNRNPKACLFAIVGAEYIARMLPRGTHDYQRFIKPSELDAWARRAGLTTQAVSGIHFNPLSATFELGGKPEINYVVACRYEDE
ncbi:MAG: bifunctional 3-demethylubiquinone 3-O-methyltransferase/2-octaprenyl-6-hydroxy phenol methylase [Gammaproteobacteria bacterium]